MKQALYTLVIILLVSLNVQAQNQNRFSMIRQRIEQAKLREIRQNLKLDQTTFMQFRPIYLKYEREISRIDFKNQARLMKANADTLSTEEADQLITSQLASAKRLVFIREKYYKAFKSVLTSQQIVKLYQSEVEIRRKVMAEKKRRMMGL